MKILEKHILKSYLSSFLFCILLLMVLGVIGDILGFLDDIFKNNIPLSSIFQFYLYFTPFAFVNMVPFACLISAVFVFNTLSKNHEISAIITSGVSLWAPIRPVLIATFIICLFTFVVNEKLVPPTVKKAGDIKQEKLENPGDAGQKAISNIAIYGKSNRMIFAKEFLPKEQKINELIIHEQDRNKSVVRKINVKTAEWDQKGYWIGTDILVFDRDRSGEFSLDPKYFKSKQLSIEEGPAEFINDQSDPKFMSYKTLSRYIKVVSQNSAVSVKRLIVDLNYKISFPFTAMITVIVGIPFSISTGRVNALIGMARGIVIAMMYIPVMAVSLAFGKSGAIDPALSAWLAYALFALVGILAVNLRS
ncbi:MAG: LptF/LptG family permease [Candidatus Omnitrophica bacterium]|nr:LptF/LptG family permease [Candidatus Omnitrophota bacterium]